MNGFKKDIPTRGLEKQNQRRTEFVHINEKQQFGLLNYSKSKSIVHGVYHGEHQYTCHSRNTVSRNPTQRKLCEYA